MDWLTAGRAASLARSQELVAARAATSRLVELKAALQWEDSAAAAGEASAEGEALEDCMDLDGAEAEPMERKPIVGRVAVNPRTGHELQALMPTSCVAAYIGIHEDLATYNHKSPAAQMEIPPEKIDSLPPHLRGMTKTSTWGDAADDVKQEHCEAVLRWAWAKHIHFFGGERPGDTVLVEGKLSLEPAV